MEEPNDAIIRDIESGAEVDNNWSGMSFCVYACNFRQERFVFEPRAGGKLTSSTFPFPLSLIDMA